MTLFWDYTWEPGYFCSQKEKECGFINLERLNACFRTTSFSLPIISSVSYKNTQVQQQMAVTREN